MKTTPMKFYYAGQLHFGNRGCEALIRSNTLLIRERFPDSTFLCPSNDASLDSRQWPDAVNQGVSFVQAPSHTLPLKLWGKLSSRIRAARGHGLHFAKQDAVTRSLIASADEMLVTGGDNLSLDYGLYSLFYWAGLVESARKIGKPTHLLAASVGPFGAEPEAERQMIKHLNGYTSITVRETSSLDYLHERGVAKAQLVADPAFVMQVEGWDTEPYIRTGRQVLGLNVSPLVRGTLGGDQERAVFDRDIVEFVREVLSTGQTDVLFVPHVDPLQGNHPNSDRNYMGKLLAALGETKGRASLLPDGLNAAQIKYALGKCTYFIGARTHATIGALSQLVPTLSISYSVKAIGINKDLFGSTDFVLPTQDVSRPSLLRGFHLLQQRGQDIRGVLAERIPLWRKKARLIPEALNSRAAVH